MRIGVPLETRDQEGRVGLGPDGAARLAAVGHEVLVEHGAGCASGFPDEQYQRVGATSCDVEQVWERADLVVKVKDPSAAEVARMHPGQILFAFLHLAAIPEITRLLREADCIALAYETIRDSEGRFPALRPMSAIAGRLAGQIGTTLLHRNHGGKGLLLGGVLGSDPGRVTVLGAGIVGSHAAQVACAMGAKVCVIDRDAERLGVLRRDLGVGVETVMASPANIESAVRETDLLIGGVYAQGSRAPRLVSEKMISQMEAGSVVIDVAVDQGGCIETTHPTTHSHPTYFVHDVLHYGVTNMPGAVPRTATQALTQVTFPYLERIAGRGVTDALREDAVLAQSLNLWRGNVVCEGLAASLGVACASLDRILPE